MDNHEIDLTPVQPSLLFGNEPSDIVEGDTVVRRASRGRANGRIRAAGALSATALASGSSP